MIEQISERGREAIGYAKSVLSGKNTMTDGKTERQWEGRFNRTVRAHGISKDKCGASPHGLRHAYAQERYEMLTGFEAPVKFDSKESFLANAQLVLVKNETWIERLSRLPHIQGRCFFAIFRYTGRNLTP